MGRSVAGDDEMIPLTVRVPYVLWQRVGELAGREGISKNQWVLNAVKTAEASATEQAAE